MAKVLISLDERLLRRIDRMAAARGLSRSAYIAELAERDATRSSGAAPSVRAALRRLDRLFASSARGESTKIVRAERDGR